MKSNCYYVYNQEHFVILERISNREFGEFMVEGDRFVNENEFYRLDFSLKYWGVNRPYEYLQKNQLRKLLYLYRTRFLKWVQSRITEWKLL